MGLEYECEGCGMIQGVNDGPYAWCPLDDGRAFFGPYGVGWCERCGGLSNVEEIPGPAFFRMRGPIRIARPPTARMWRGIESGWPHRATGHRPDGTRRDVSGPVGPLQDDRSCQPFRLMQE